MSSPATDEAVSVKPAWRLALVMMLVAAAAVVAAMLVLQVFVARRLPDLTAERLEAAQQTWQQHGPASYVMELTLGGAQPGAVQIEVRDGEVTAMTRNGRSPAQRRTWVVWSVPGMFETLEREMELAEDPVHEMDAASGTRLRIRCEFDPQTGLPREYHRMVTGGGPEVYWRVTRFDTPHTGE